MFQKVREEGGRTPQIAFMVNTKAGETAEQLYLDLYKPGRFRELWFHWQGKPLLLCDPDQATPEVKRILHAPPRPLAVYDGRYEKRLALGGDLSAAVLDIPTIPNGRSRSTSRSPKIYVRATAV